MQMIRKTTVKLWSLIQKQDSLNLSLGKKLEWAISSSASITSSSQLISFSLTLLGRREYATLKLKTWMVKLI
jgi:hypothetical protein